VLSPSRITLEYNEKIWPQPDRENAFAGASGGGDGTGVERSLVPKSLVLIVRYLVRQFFGSIATGGETGKQQSRQIQASYGTRPIHPTRRRAGGILNGFDSVLSNGPVDAINGLIQSAKARARGYRKARNFILMAYLIADNLSQLPASPCGTKSRAIVE
jgi:hypothetical protein